MDLRNHYSIQATATKHSLNGRKAKKKRDGENQKIQRQNKKERAIACMCMQAGETIKHIDDIGPKVANIATQRERERERKRSRCRTRGWRREESSRELKRKER
jgi:hypothetical protein